jgi:hypothetical protein
MVAVALAANAADASGEAGRGDTFARIRDYLGSKDIDALVAMIVDMAGQDLALLRKLDIAAAMFGADDKEIESQLRKAIRDATRTRGFVEYARAPEWAAGVDAALDLLAGMTSGPRAALGVEIAEYAIARIERAIEDIDDSGGHGGALLARVQGLHLDACRAARPDPVSLAGDLFGRETEGDYDTFYAAAAEYADVLGEEGLAEYRRLAQESWEKASSPTGHGQDADSDRPDVFRLVPILDFFAERDGDVEMRIALRSRNLTSQWAYLRLAEFCQAHGREAEALRHAEEGLWLFEDDRPDERLVFFAADLCVKAERKADAEAHLWRAFEKAPSLDLYCRIRDLGGEAASRRAVGYLQQRLVNAASTQWDPPADLLIRVLIEEKIFDTAWAVARDYQASPSVMRALAEASEATHANQALAVYAAQVEDLAGKGGGMGYEEAAGLIARMATLRGVEAQAGYLADVKERHKRKRNFMKLLG